MGLAATHTQLIKKTNKRGEWGLCTDLDPGVVCCTRQRTGLKAGLLETGTPTQDLQVSSSSTDLTGTGGTARWGRGGRPDQGPPPLGPGAAPVV